MMVRLSVLPIPLSVCRLEPAAAIPAWASAGPLVSITRTAHELSVVCESVRVPGGTRAEHGWRALAVQGPLDFGLVGIVAGLSACLADAGVSIFVISTYDTDFVLVREDAVTRAVAALRDAGHVVHAADHRSGAE